MKISILLFANFFLNISTICICTNDKVKSKMVEEKNIPHGENVYSPPTEGGREARGQIAIVNNKNDFDDIYLDQFDSEEIMKTIASLDEDIGNGGNAPEAIGQQFSHEELEFIQSSNLNTVCKFISLGNWGAIQERCSMV